MPEIEISDAQREYLESLRDELAERHAGAYAHVRPRDALQFLIDHREDEVSEGADEAADDGETAADDAAEGDDGASGPDRLQAMMNLLDEHDDKWEQVEGEDGRYAVTLPDGGTEHARTKDDVRALLFEHYG